MYRRDVALGTRAGFWGLQVTARPLPWSPYVLLPCSSSAYVFFAVYQLATCAPVLLAFFLGRVNATSGLLKGRVLRCWLAAGALSLSRFPACEGSSPSQQQQQQQQHQPRAGPVPEEDLARHYGIILSVKPVAFLMPTCSDPHAQFGCVCLYALSSCTLPGSCVCPSSRHAVSMYIANINKLPG